MKTFSFSSRFSVLICFEFFHYGLSIQVRFSTGVDHCGLTSAQAEENLCQILSSHFWCSGFLNTERRQVTCASPNAFLAAGANAEVNHDCGNCTRARCRCCAAHASNTSCASCDDLSGVTALIFHATISSSGWSEASGSKRQSARKWRLRSRAAARPCARPRANSPPATGGSS